MKYVQPTNANVLFMVDDEDYERVMQFRWYLHHRYPTRWEKEKEISLHGFILDHYWKGSEYEVHHKDENPLNNQKNNLVILPFSAHRSTVRARKDNEIGVKGVNKKYRNGRFIGYVAQIYSNKKKIHIGLFKTVEEAARAYDNEAKRLHGEHAFTNDLSK